MPATTKPAVRGAGLVLPLEGRGRAGSGFLYSDRDHAAIGLDFAERVCGGSVVHRGLERFVGAVLSAIVCGTLPRLTGC